MNRTVTIAAIVAVVAVLTPAGASAGTTLRTTARPQPTSASAGDWLAAERQALQRAGAVVYQRTAATSPAYSASPHASLQAVGRLGTSKHADVLDVRQHVDSVGITARVGATGKPLWSMKFHASILEEVAAMAAPVGASGQRGVVIVEASETRRSATLAADLKVLAVSAQGRTLWTHTFKGQYANNGESTDVPFFDGMLPRPGHASNLLAEVRSAAGSTQSTQADSVSGTHGTITPIGGAATATLSSPSFSTIPDANGDGRADVLLQVPQGASGYIQAESSATGAVLWTDNMTIFGAADRVVLGKYRDGSDPDLAIETTSLNVPSITVVDLISGAPEAGSIPGYAVSIEHFAATQIPVLLVYNTAQSTTATTTTETLTYSAYSAGGAVVYSTPVSTSVTDPADATSNNGFGTVDAIGDLQSDGSPDLRVTVEADASSATADHHRLTQGLIDGHTGSFTPFTFSAPSDGSLRHGATTDLLGITPAHGRSRLTAWRGSNRKRYYRKALATVAGTKGDWVSGLRVTNHACSDIAVTSASNSHGELALVSARGTPVWSVTFKDTQITGGALTRAKAPQHFCV
jgi:hypothetical protein